MENKNKWLIGIIVVILVIVLGVYYSNNTNSDKSDIKIAFVAPLTGDVASVGQGMQIAAELAVSEINKAGGINGRQVMLISEDAKCDGKAAVSAVTKVINVDKVNAIVGAACSSETVASAPVAEAAKVVMMSPLSSSPDITNAGDYIFRDYPSDAFQGARAAELAVNTLKAKNIAVMSCASGWCDGIKQVFIEKAKSLGANIVFNEGFNITTSKDLKTPLTKIKSLNPDLIYFLGYNSETVIGLKQAKEIGLKIQMLGGDSWNDPQVLAGAGSAAEGMIYLVPKAIENQTFKTELSKVNGNKGIVMGSAETYDAVKILAQTMAKVGTDSTKIKNALYKVQNYQGVSGQISFDKNGDLSSATYDVKTVRNGKVENY